MSNTIHGKSHQVIKYFREQAAALEVYWVYCARATNKENAAWPTVRRLADDTGFNKDTCGDARSWLVEHGALEPIPDFVRPSWRNDDPEKLQRKLNLDKAEYYRPTGVLVVNGTTYPLLFNTPGEQSDPADDEPTPDVRPDRTTNNPPCPTPPDVRPDRTEDSTIKDSQDDSSFIDSSNEESIEPPSSRRNGSSPLPPESETPTISDEEIEVGKTVYVWSDVRRKFIACGVLKVTAEQVQVRSTEPNAFKRDEFRRSKANVRLTIPKLKTLEDYSPEQQAVLKACRNVQSGEGIPGETIAYANTILSMLKDRYEPAGTMPDAEELEAIFEWAADGDEYFATGKYQNPEKITNFVAQYRLEFGDPGDRNPDDYIELAEVEETPPQEDVEIEIPVSVVNADGSAKTPEEIEQARMSFVNYVDEIAAD